MRYRRLTKDGDYSFGANAQDYISGVQAVAQAIKTKIMLFYGEWWENIGIGIPMFQSILGQVKTDSLKIAIHNLFTERILQIPQVTSVDNVDIDFNRRNLLVTVKCTVENEEQVEVGVSL